jgi:prepilin peptidase CpaA
MNMSEIAIVIIGSIACATDITTRRIPNWLTFGGAAAALVAHAALSGMPGVTMAASGWAVGVLLFAPMFLLMGMGAGDVKLLAAFGAWVGPSEIVSIAIAAALAGAVIALIFVAVRRRMRQTLTNLYELLRFWYFAGIQPFSTLTVAEPGALRLAYAIPITAGALMTSWFSWSVL